MDKSTRFHNTIEKLENSMVKITKTEKGNITQITAADKTYDIGDDTHLGVIRSFFSSGDVVWVDMESNNQFPARLLFNPTTKK